MVILIIRFGTNLLELPACADFGDAKVLLMLFGFVIVKITFISGERMQMLV